MNILTDVSNRVYNHKWNFDPIWRSMLDTDFYKLLMAQFIWKNYKDTKVSFFLKNRTTTVNIGKELNHQELVNQLDHARTVKLTRGESTFLRGNTFYGKRQIFESEFIDWLETFTLPEYRLSYNQTGDIELTFWGTWLQTTLWEIPALSIINELRSRAAMKDMSRFEIDVTYAKAKAKLWNKLITIKSLYNEGHQFKISDFGTRRRHSFLWQRWAVQACLEALGSNFIGTSNALMAKENDLEAIGTNAHELPMAIAALAQSDAQLAQSPYNVLRTWEQMYHGNLRVLLPDTFGTANFLAEHASYGENSYCKWLASWKGIRPDSRPWKEGGEEILKFWTDNEVDPKDRLLILADGMDTESIIGAVKSFANKTNLSIGWGTNLTNDFRKCTPDEDDMLKPISLVCKVYEVEGRRAVKLSDNPSKFMGSPEEIERYKTVFNYPEESARSVDV